MWFRSSDNNAFVHSFISLRRSATANEQKISSIHLYRGSCRRHLQSIGPTPLVYHYFWFKLCSFSGHHFTI